MVLRFVIGRTTPAVRLERFKMLAGGIQLIAVGVIGASIVAPFFNPSMKPTSTSVIAGGVVAAAIELLAMRIMSYMSPRTPGRRRPMLELFERLLLAGVPFAIVLWLGLYIEARWIGPPKLD